MPEPPTVFDLDSVGPPEGAISVSNPADPDAKIIRVFKGKLPAHATVRVTNLDRMDPTVAVDVPESDGVNLIVPVTDGQELRFEVVTADQRSQPADAIFVLDGGVPSAFHLEPSERFACLKLDPGYRVDAGGATATLSLENGCSSAVTLESPRSRLALPDFSLTTTLPLEIAAGTSRELTVDVTPGTGSVREDVLFVDATLDGKTLRYPITFRAE